MCGAGAYKDLLTNAQFGAVVRGDTFYSYRFLEVGVRPIVVRKYSHRFLEVWE
jgi:hypothetical protein